MPAHTRTTFDWTLEFTPPGGVGSTLTFSSGNLHKVRPSAWKLDQRDDVMASSLEIRFPDAGQFMNAWNVYNPTAPGTEVVLRVDGFTRFTGWLFDHSLKYSANDRSVTVVAKDRMGMLKDACVDVKLDRETLRADPDDVSADSYQDGDGRFLMTRNGDDGYLFEAITDDATPIYLRPWHPDYIVIVWIEVETDVWCRVPFSEYEVLYDIGAIYFRYSAVKCIGMTDDEAYDLDETTPDIETSIYAEFVYYDADDDSTMISNLLREAFEHPEATGGLAWTEGADYDIDDETTGDILSGMKWNTDEGDGDAISFLQNFYDNPRIGLSPSYWIRDFNGNGKVNARLVAQDNDAAIDVDLIFDAQYPSPLTNIYTRAVLVNNDATRVHLTRDVDVFTDIFAGVADVTETPKMPDDVAHKHVEYLADDTSKTSWGYFKIGHRNQYALDHDLPKDIPFIQIDFGELKPVDTIHLNTHWTFEGGDEAQDWLHDDVTGEEAVNGLYKIHQNQRITVEYNADVDATPDDDRWFVLHPDLYNAEVDPLDARNSWLTVENINKEVRYLRVIINNPLFGKVSETNYTNKAFRIMLWWMSEFQVYGRGRVLAGDTEEQPEVKFTDDPEDENRCMCNLAGEQVDMYRPTLLTLTAAMGLKYRTLVLETADVWEFYHEDDEVGTTPDDCDEVSVGYKYLVTRLDSASKENEWQVRIDPRPDIRVGSTVYSSKLNVDRKFLVHGNSLQMVGGQLMQVLTLSDHETCSGGEGTGCA